MSDALSSLRRPILAGKNGGSAAVRLIPAAPAARASIRANADALAALSSALGVALPTEPRTSASAGSVHALWLGPDEWMLIGPDGTDFVGLAAKSGTLHSAVDVSHRNVAIIVSGPGAVDTIRSACPHNLTDAVFPVGACARTVFGKIEIVLYRESEDSYRVECWRSFADYCFGMLSEGANDAVY